MPNEKLDPISERSAGGARPQQRRFLRANVEIPVSYAIDAEWKRARAVNLGGGGLRLATDDDIPSGTMMRLRFSLPGQSNEFAMRGRVVLSFFNAVEGHYAHGVAFTQIDPDEQEAIVRFINEQQRIEMQRGGQSAS